MHAENLLKRLLEESSQDVIELCCRLIQIPSEDPPGDTREISAFIHDYFTARGVKSEIVAGLSDKPNVVATVDGCRPGQHVVFNGHMDTFRVGNIAQWRYDPFGGERVNGRIYGRGAADMKGGLACSIQSVVLLNQMKAAFPGKISITCVSDEEVFGAWGSRYLLTTRPELLGDALINGEPSSLDNVRIGEKGQYWFRFTSRTEGGHGAYAALKPSAVRILMNLLEKFTAIPEELSNIPAETRQIMDQARDCFDSLLCDGAATAACEASVNIGTIHGGLSVNMVPEECVAEVDFRLPPGVSPAYLRTWIASIMDGFPLCTVEEFSTQDAYLTDISDPLVQIAKQTAEEILGKQVFTPFSLGGTEARLWRKYGTPAITYGPNHHNMGSPDEYVEEAELPNVLKVQALTALRFILAQDKNRREEMNA